MGIRIVTDSSSDLNKEFEMKYNVEVVPLTVHFNDGFYKDRKEITSKQFFEKLQQQSEIPTTTQVNPKEFESIFSRILSEGDEIIGIFISSEMSGTYNSAVIAKEMLQSDKIHIIDSRGVTLALGLLVVKAAQLVQEGKTSREIVSQTLENIEKMKSVMIVDTLDYLRKGGRLSASQAFIGGVLNLKPILTFEDGKLVPMDKVRGRKKALKWVRKWIDTNKYDLKNKTIYMLHATDQEYMNELKEILVKDYGASNIIESEVGAIVGTHSGPSAIAMCFIDI